MMPRSLKLIPIVAFALLANAASRNVDEAHARAKTDFLTSVQHQLNPQNKDVGQQLWVLSERTFQGTLGNCYFWLTGISLATSALLSWYIAFLIQQRKRREIISAKLLAWYHNEFVCAREAVRSTTARSPEAPAQGSEDHSADVLSELSRLRQQVVSQEGTEKVLRAQINSLSKKLTEEKQKNKSLKPE